ncbi:hypothetical protein [Adhaeribacter terreus]|uniref:Uncharacterized protein n=1 Tax=Adhaeribacter terreus TaxID=529703 RepID=A0ABW0EAW8_9BACT
MENLEYLNREIIEPLAKCIGLRLDKIVYSDFGSQEELTTDNDGVDIISYQAILKFESEKRIYFSWNSVSVWDHYTISVSEKTFIEKDPDQVYEVKSKFTRFLVGKQLTGFGIFGYQKNQWTETHENGKKIVKTFFNQPHLIVLDIEGMLLGFANFYREENFVPKLPMGDDVWVIYSEDHINNYIEIFGFEELYKYSK